MTIRDWYRYYFIRKKAPLSHIWWHGVLRRQSMGTGHYDVNIAVAGESDCSIWLSKGSPANSAIEISVFDFNGDVADTVTIPLSYRSMARIIDGFDKADSISRAILQRERASRGITEPPKARGAKAPAAQSNLGDTK